MKKMILCMLILILLLAGCDQQNNILTQTTEAPQAATIPTPTDMFTDRDLGTEPKNSVYSIVLSDSGTRTDCNSVSANGSTVTITEEADYLISGSFSDGMIIVDADKEAKLHLILDSVNITSNSSAALYIKQADKVVVTLNGENTLSSGNTFLAIDENEIDAAVYSKDDLTFNGSGNLTVSSPAGRGVSSKDDLVFTGGSYKITCSGHALDANDSIRIKDSSFTISAGKDGIHAENNDDTSLGFVYVESGTLDIVAEGDGISGGAYVQLQDGAYELVTGGGSINGQQHTSSNFGGFGGGRGPGGPGGGGMRPGGGGGRYAVYTVEDSTAESTSIKGIKAGTELLIAGGCFNIDAADDSLHANGSVTITNGDFTLSSGDDGIHADETLLIGGGTITVSESYEGLEGLTVRVNGGDIILTCEDDGINAAGGTDSSGYGGIRGDRFGGGASNGAVIIAGGKIYMNASGDGIDANGSITISGGHTTVCGPTVGDTAVLDYDTTAEITGGTFIGTGSSMMAQTFTSSTQGVIALSVGNQNAGTLIQVQDENENVLISDKPKLDFAIMIVSCPEMVQGKNYTVTVGNFTDSFLAN